MDKYISQQDALSTYCKDCCIDCGDSMCADWNKIRKWISSIPAADVAPVVHGKWIEEPVAENISMVKCSACRKYPEKKGQCFTQYCCLCGAKMDL